MTIHILINSAGLVADIIGAIMLWRFGLPEEFSRSGAVHLIAEQPDEAERAKAKHYDVLAKVGIGLLIAGFSLQLASNFL